MKNEVLKNWKETIVYLCKLLGIKTVEGMLFILDKRDEYRVAHGKKPTLPR